MDRSTLEDKIQTRYKRPSLRFVWEYTLSLEGRKTPARFLVEALADRRPGTVFSHLIHEWCV